jgi:hypothetical protein
MRRRFTVSLAHSDDCVGKVRRGAAGAIEADNGAVASALLRSATGIEMEDTSEEGEVLFLSDDAAQTPLEIELHDGAGNLAGRHAAVSS